MSNRNNARLIIGAIATGLSVASAIHTYLEVRESERQKRAKIAEEEKLQIKALQDAAKTVRKRVLEGHYDGQLSVERIMTDMRFETMINRYDK
jgi:hypothetical protein